MPTNPNRHANPHHDERGLMPNEIEQANPTHEPHGEPMTETAMPTRDRNPNPNPNGGPMLPNDEPIPDTLRTIDPEPSTHEDASANAPVLEGGAFGIA